MTGEERVLGALQLQPIDRVPTFEWLISQNVRDMLAPGSTYNEFIEAMDIDAACIELDWHKEWLTEATFRDDWGIVKAKTEEEYATPVSGPLEGAADLASYVPPDFMEERYYKTLEDTLEFHRGKRAVILRLNDVFSIPSRLCVNYEEFMCAMLIEPEYIRDLIDMTVDTYLGFAREAYRRGCRIAFTGDDYAHNTAPLMSPDTFRDLFYPPLKRVMQGYRDIGLLVIKHSDGDIKPLLNMIMDTEINCIDPIDPLGGLDLKTMKETYGSRFCIKGNVACAGSLSIGTVGEVVEETKSCLRTAMGTTGYICSSSNSILASVKPENYKAMLDTIKEYGIY